MKISNTLNEANFSPMSDTFLSEGQIYMLFNRIGSLTESDRCSTELRVLWESAGTPLDISQLTQIMKSHGIRNDVISNVLSDMKITLPKTMTYQELAAEVAKHRPRDRRLLIAALQKQLGIATP